MVEAPLSKTNNNNNNNSLGAPTKKRKAVTDVFEEEEGNFLRASKKPKTKDASVAVLSPAKDVTVKKRIETIMLAPKKREAAIEVVQNKKKKKEKKKKEKREKRPKPPSKLPSKGKKKEKKKEEEEKDEEEEAALANARSVNFDISKMDPKYLKDLKYGPVLRIIINQRQTMTEEAELKEQEKKNKIERAQRRIEKAAKERQELLDNCESLRWNQIAKDHRLYMLSVNKDTDADAKKSITYCKVIGKEGVGEGVVATVEMSEIEIIEMKREKMEPYLSNPLFSSSKEERALIRPVIDTVPSPDLWDRIPEETISSHFFQGFLPPERRYNIVTNKWENISETVDSYEQGSSSKSIPTKSVKGSNNNTTGEAKKKDHQEVMGLHYKRYDRYSDGRSRLQVFADLYSFAMTCKKAYRALRPVINLVLIGNNWDELSGNYHLLSLPQSFGVASFDGYYYTRNGRENLGKLENEEREIKECFVPPLSSSNGKEKPKDTIASIKTLLQYNMEESRSVKYDVHSLVGVSTEQALKPPPSSSDGINEYLNWINPIDHNNVIIDLDEEEEEEDPLKMRYSRFEVKYVNDKDYQHFQKTYETKKKGGGGGSKDFFYTRSARTLTGIKKKWIFDEQNDMIVEDGFERVYLAVMPTFIGKKSISFKLATYFIVFGNLECFKNLFFNLSGSRYDQGYYYGSDYASSIHMKTWITVAVSYGRWDILDFLLLSSVATGTDRALHSIQLSQLSSLFTDTQDGSSSSYKRLGSEIENSILYPIVPTGQDSPEGTRPKGHPTTTTTTLSDNRTKILDNDDDDDNIEDDLFPFGNSSFHHKLCKARRSFGAGGLSKTSAANKYKSFFDKKRGSFIGPNALETCVFPEDVLKKMDVSTLTRCYNIMESKSIGLTDSDLKALPAKIASTSIPGRRNNDSDDDDDDDDSNEEEEEEDDDDDDESCSIFELDEKGSKKGKKKNKNKRKANTGIKNNGLIMSSLVLGNVAILDYLRSKGFLHLDKHLYLENSNVYNNLTLPSCLLRSQRYEEYCWLYSPNSGWNDVVWGSKTKIHRPSLRKALSQRFSSGISASREITGQSDVQLYDIHRHISSSDPHSMPLDYLRGNFPCTFLISANPHSLHYLKNTSRPSLKDLAPVRRNSVTDWNKADKQDNPNRILLLQQKEVFDRLSRLTHCATSFEGLVQAIKTAPLRVFELCFSSLSQCVKSSRSNLNLLNSSMLRHFSTNDSDSSSSKWKCRILDRFPKHFSPSLLSSSFFDSPSSSLQGGSHFLASHFFTKSWLEHYAMLFYTFSHGPRRDSLFKLFFLLLHSNRHYILSHHFSLTPLLSSKPDDFDSFYSNPDSPLPSDSHFLHLPLCHLFFLDDPLPSFPSLLPLFLSRVRSLLLSHDSLHPHEGAGPLRGSPPSSSPPPPYLGFFTFSPFLPSPPPPSDHDPDLDPSYDDAGEDLDPTLASSTAPILTDAELLEVLLD